MRTSGPPILTKARSRSPVSPRGTISSLLRTSTSTRSSGLIPLPSPMPRATGTSIWATYSPSLGLASTRGAYSTTRTRTASAILKRSACPGRMRSSGSGMGGSIRSSRRTSLGSGFCRRSSPSSSGWCSRSISSVTKIRDSRISWITAGKSLPTTGGICLRGGCSIRSLSLRRMG